MKKAKHIHFVGIKGVGMTPLAIIAKESGMIVSGCDTTEVYITDSSLKKAGINPLPGFSKDHLSGVDLLITTAAHGGFDNPEVGAAQKNGIKVLTQGEALGVFMEGGIFNRSFLGISVTGTHGKTTTTAMVVTILKNGGYDPTYSVGTSNIASLGLPGHFGKGNFFVAEADEYATEPKYDRTIKFLWQKPKIALFTSIDFDHPDIYSSIDEVRNAFLEFATKLDSKSTLVACGDEHEVVKLLKSYSGNRLTYGFSHLNDYVLKKVYFSEGQTFFWVESHNANLGQFSIQALGEHNGLNALGSIVVAIELGIPLEKIRKALSTFSGTKRRSEYIGQLESKALLFDDYAHHPTEIKKTLQAFKSMYPKSKIICIFQPHMYSRTKKLFEQFLHSFSNADSVILVDIFPSAREEKDHSVSSKMLADNMKRFHKDVLYLGNKEDVIEYLTKQKFGKDVLILTMGAGDVYKIGEMLPLL